MDGCTHHVLKAHAPKSDPLVDCSPMTSSAFTTGLERNAGQYLPSVARRIAALLPQIEAAKAAGSSRAHIVAALLDAGIEISPHQLSNVISRLRRRSGNGLNRHGGCSTTHSGDGSRLEGVGSLSRVEAPATVGRHVFPRSPSAHAGLATANPPWNFGAHDPRLLDEVMRSTPDMRALAKLAKP